MQNEVPRNAENRQLEVRAVATEINSASAKWEVIGSGKYSIVGDTSPALPKGKYSLRWQNGRLCFDRREIHSDQLLQFPDSVFEKTLSEIRKFWSLKQRFYENGFLHRRGYLLHGPQGTGKSCLIQQVINIVLEIDGIVLDCDSNPDSLDQALLHLRKVEPDRPLLCLYEDIDALVDKHGESNYLQLLDGENLIDNVLNIGTTNHIEKLNPRIQNRQRRFDRIVEVGYPTLAIREKYLIEKLKMDKDKAEELAAQTNKCSFAALADLVISVNCLGMSIPEALAEMDSLKKNKSSSDFNESFGFGRSSG